AWDSWIRLEAGLEHHGERRRFKDAAVLADSAVEQRGDETPHVTSRRVNRALSPADPVTVPHGSGTCAANAVPGGETRRHPCGPRQVGVGHAQRIEDVRPEV